MEKTKKITVKRVLVWLACSILPILAIALGCILLIGDTIFNVAFTITYVIIPFVSAVLIALIIFSAKRTSSKVILTVLVLIVFAVTFLFSSMVGTFEMLTYKKNKEIGESYAETCEEFDMMPTLEEAGLYAKAEHYDYFSSTLGFFTCDADTLIVCYDSAEYQKQKALLDEKYVFQEEAMSEFGYAIQPFAEIKGYSFRVLAVNDEYGWQIFYPKRLVFIATNDKDCSIAYTAFYDDDLDYIEDLEDFLLKDCGWKYIA